MKYYIHKTPTKPSTGEHEIHRETCSKITGLFSLYLNYYEVGEFSNDYDALEFARRRYPFPVDGCGVCSHSTTHTR